MKKRFLKPMMSLAIVATLGYGCAGTNDSSATNTDTGTTDNTEMDAGTTGTAGTTTDGTTDAGTTNAGNTGVGTGTNDTAMDTERVANRAVDVADMFEDVDNTEQYDVMTLARRYDNLSTFVRLIEMAGLEESFNAAASGMTFFIPTNEAFEQLPKERYDQLTDPANKAELMRVLNLHVFRTELPASRFTGRQVLDLGEGNQVTVDTGTAGAGAGAGAATTTIGGATVVKSDVRASNGIIHIIDGIIATDNDLNGTNETGTDN